jgi:hypothetical protein
MIRKRTRVALFVAAALALGATVVGPSGASAAPPDQPVLTANHNGVVVPAPRAGLLPIGRTTAGAVPVSLPAGFDKVSDAELAKARPPLTERPYGGDRYGLTVPGRATFCTASLNVEATSGSPYLMTAGHCARSASEGGVSSDYFYPYPTGPDIAHSARWNYDSTGDHAAIRMMYDQDPAKWRGSDGAFRTVAGVGNPVVNETAQAILGQSGYTVTGTVINANMCQAFDTDPPGSCHNNIALLQAPLGACINGGDSGSPVNVGFDVVGTAVAGWNFGGHCLIYFDRMGSTLQAYGLFAG